MYVCALATFPVLRTGKVARAYTLGKNQIQCEFFKLKNNNSGIWIPLLRIVQDSPLLRREDDDPCFSIIVAWDRQGRLRIRLGWLLFFLPRP